MVNLNRLNPQQRTAAATLRGPVLVLAGAGTGKTHVLTHRIAHLLDTGVPPEAVLAVTFTNKAAREMKERVAGLVGARAAALWISTFHSLCARILRRDIERLGYKPNFTIYDTSDQISVLRATLRDIKVPGTEVGPDKVLAYISRAKSAAISPADAARGEDDGDPAADIAVSAFGRYQEALRERNALDFDDLLTLTVRLLSEHDDIRRHYQDRFRYSLVDEYQDTNGIQYKLVKLLLHPQQNLFVVGDDDQSIYGWRGADSKHILNFDRDFPRCAVIRLEQNYRSTMAILTAANTLIKVNQARHGKTLWSALGDGAPVIAYEAPDERGEAEFVIGRIREEQRKDDVPWGHFAVLFRTNNEMRLYEEQLRLWRIPYRLIGGQKFFDKKEIKDLTAYLKVLANPADEVSLLRIVNTPPRGIGKTTIERLDAYAVGAGIPLSAALCRAGEVGGITEKLAERVARFGALLSRYRDRMKKGGGLAPAVRDLLAEIDYAADLARQYPEPEQVQARANGLTEFVADLEHFDVRRPGGTLDAYLEAMALMDDERDGDDKKLSEDAVTLITIHSAKGLEFPRVFVPGMEEGLMPHKRSIAEEEDRSIEEERRLCYVAWTRARQRLSLSYPAVRTRWGRTDNVIPSRFLKEAKDKVRLEAAPKPGPATEAVATDYFAQLSALFGKRSAAAPAPSAPAPARAGAAPARAAAAGAGATPGGA
ncbi:MAG: UvrD-helicase domain-containing protein, partial [Planctomycetes bacterium]|nr:UvrD-helicase domain-containing protein [Planctomycetota bacterium]